MLEFFSTGEICAKDLLRDLARLGIQLGIRGLTSSFFPSTFTPGAANGADFIVPGFANGGSGRMRAANSSDQVPVLSLAQPGERVIIETTTAAGALAVQRPAGAAHHQQPGGGEPVGEAGRGAPLASAR